MAPPSIARSYAWALAQRPLSSISHALGVEVVGEAAVFAGLAVHYGESVRLTFSPATFAPLSLISGRVRRLPRYRLVLNVVSVPFRPLIALAASALWPGVGLNGLIGAAEGLVPGS